MGPFSFKFITIKLKIHFLILEQSIFQVLNRYLWQTATILDKTVLDFLINVFLIQKREALYQKGLRIWALGSSLAGFTSWLSEFPSSVTLNSQFPLL